jgi:hypothetical protein
MRSTVLCLSANHLRVFARQVLRKYEGSFEHVNLNLNLQSNP